MPNRMPRERLMEHGATVVWLTGFSGAGKTTIAIATERELNADGIKTCIVDGDDLRSGLSRDLDFSSTSRTESVRRAVEVAKLMFDAGLVVFVCLISPFRLDRENARHRVGAEDFIEVHINTPLSICAYRDTKGLYAQAKSGRLPDLTGVGQEYEPPQSPELVVSGAGDSSEAARIIAEVVRQRVKRPPIHDWNKRD